MRSSFLAAAVLLAGCVTAPSSTRPEEVGGSCHTEGGTQFIGQSGTAETGASILRATHSSILRWAPPGAMLTMDFNPSRITVRLGPDGKIAALDCG